MESHFISCCSSSSFQFWEIPLRVKALTELSSQHAPLFLSAPFFFFPNFDKLPCLSQSASKICPKLTNQRRDQRSNWVKRKGKERKRKEAFDKKKGMISLPPHEPISCQGLKGIDQSQKGASSAAFFLLVIGRKLAAVKVAKKKKYQITLDFGIWLWTLLAFWTNTEGRMLSSFFDSDSQRDSRSDFLN